MVYIGVDVEWYGGYGVPMYGMVWYGVSRYNIDTRGTLTCATYGRYYISL